MFNLFFKRAIIFLLIKSNHNFKINDNLIIVISELSFQADCIDKCLFYYYENLKLKHYI
jgi:hypothetical protein